MKSKTGFTLLELLVVMSIIGLLSSIVLASLGSVRAKARDAVRYSDVRQINNAIQLYLLSNKTVPPGSFDFEEYPSSSDTDWNWRINPTTDPFQNALKPYIKKLPYDPCGQNCPGADTNNWFGYTYISVPGTTRYMIYTEKMENTNGRAGFNYTNFNSLVPNSNSAI